MTAIAGRYAVVGNPVDHSLSPQIHAAFAQQRQRSMTYVRLHIPTAVFASTAAAFFGAGGHGLNVTVPFKQDAHAFAVASGGASDLARMAGAVNTLVRRKDGKIQGFNTDGPGLVRDLQDNLGLSLAGLRVLLLGAGGSARGVLAPLLACAPSELLLANRTREKAATLAEQFAQQAPDGTRLRDCALHELPAGADLVINATASSLAADAEAFPSHIFADAHCYDLMYGPRTQFCVDSLRLGARASYDGLGMLVEQAALAFELWHQTTVDTGPVLEDLRARGLGRALTANHGPQR